MALLGPMACGSVASLDSVALLGPVACGSVASFGSVAYGSVAYGFVAYGCGSVAMACGYGSDLETKRVDSGSAKICLFRGSNPGI